MHGAPEQRKQATNWAHKSMVWVQKTANLPLMASSVAIVEINGPHFGSDQNRTPLMELCVHNRDSAMLWGTDGF